MTAPTTPRFALSAQKRAVLDALLRREGTAPAPAPDPAPAIPRRQEGVPIPLSFAQQRLWFLDQLEPGSGAYNLPAAVRLEGPLDVDVLARALDALVARHEALRTTFAAAEGRPEQVVAPRLAVPLPVVDLSALPPAAREAAVVARAQEEAGAPFDLGEGPLLRAALLRLGPAAHVLLLTLHHIVADGWSMGVFIQELGALCDVISRGAEPALPALPVQYGDYAAWQRGWLRGEVLEGQLAYWRAALAGLPPLELPADRPRPATPSSRGATARAVFPVQLTAALRRLAEGEGATLFMVLLGAYQALLGRYSGQADLAVGAPVANRTRPELGGLIGFFANTLVLRADLSGAPTVRGHLARVREACLGAYAHQDVPFEKLVEELRPVREAGRNPLVQAVFTLDGSSHQPLRFGQVQATLLDVHGATAKFDLLLECSERADGLHATIEYSTDLFERETAQRLLGHLATLLEGMAADPDARLDDLPLLPAAERAQLLTGWGANAVPYPAQDTVHGLFAAQAGRTPDAVALSGDGDPLTYGELEARANRLAHHLASLGVGPETRVGLCLDRSAGAVAAILAVLKAGGAYVPLDPAYPPARLAEMLEDAGVEVLLTESRLAGRLPATSGRMLLLDDPDLRAAVATRPASDPSSEVGPDHLVYVMYTSGSTGRPKGVAVTHRGVVRLVKGADYARLGPEEVFLQFAPLSFDASTLELWGPLLNGGRLALLPAGEMPSLADLGRAIRTHGVTTLWLTAGLFHQMVESQLEDLQGLRQLLAGGDVLSVPHVRRVLEGLPGCRLINGYGPTECTTFTTCFPVTAGATLVPSVPIGRPIANTEVYVLDRRRQPVPAGVPGELYVGGPGLARGYLGRPGLTGARFVPHPFVAGARLYRTGDLVRWLPQGTLEFLGRLDQQVKIRGFRIEPGEVEAALATHPEVGAAAVVVRGDGPGGEKRLVAYVTPRDSALSGAPSSAPESGALRAYLQERLPAYLIPGAFVTLEALPLSPNGKVDRKALPAPAAAGDIAGEEDVAPRTAEEEAIAAIWAELLGVPRVGVGADFFALGGHSLLATQVVARVRDAFGVELPLRALFEAPTVAGLAARVGAAAAAAAAAGGEGDAAPAGQPLAAGPPPVLPVPRDGSPLPLSFAQQRLWFLDQLEPGSGAYNLPAAVRLTGPLDPAALQRALDALVARHEALRTTFAAAEGRPEQVVAPALAVPLPVADLSALPPAAREAAVVARAQAEAGAPFDLAAGPLLRAALLRLGPAAHVLLLTLHHIVADGWSMGVLLRDLSALYAAQARGEAPALPALPVQYGDYAAWQRGWLRGEVLEGQLAYWRAALAGLPPLELPADRPRPPVRSSDGAVVTALIPPPLVAALRRLAEGEGATLFMVLLGAYQALLGRYSGQADLAVGAPVANRTRPELGGLIGFFANTLVLRADLSGAPTVRGHLARVREACLGAYAHQDVPFEKLVEELQPVRDPSRTPLVQVAFSLQHALPAGPDFGGLSLEPLPEGGATAKFDLTLALEETPAGLRAVAEYSTDLFQRETVQRLLGHYQALLEGFVARQDGRLDDLPLLSDQEAQRLLRQWNATARPYPHQRCVHHLVAEQAALAPQAVAVAGPSGSLTYGELNARANRLAHHLLSLGVRPETRVGVCLGRSPELVVAFLAVLKAGGAYLPVDPAYPPERLAGMLEDAGALAVLTAGEAAAGLPTLGEARLVRLDDPAEAEAIAARPATAPPTSAATTTDHLAYVIYTSGSTGRPKGVQVPHAGLTNLVFWHQRAFGLTPEDRATQVASPAFDAATWELWPYLACGASVHVPDEDTRAAPEALRDWLVAQGITVSFLPTPLAEAVMALPWPPASALRLLLTGGDALRRPPPAGLPFDLINNYGPTEYSVVTTSGYVPPAGAHQPPGRADLPPGIGRPVANTQVYVLDRRRRPVPAGVPGELYVGGDGLARGYLGRPGLTGGRFVPHPFGAPGARLYRTGDLVRWVDKGDLEFLGRLDQQVKIRGFRIEPGEVEATLATHPQVREVVVVAQDRPGSADKRLVAYVVLQRAGASPEAPDAPEARRRALPSLRAYLQERLPAYMVPGAFVALDALPLTPNGKLDRKALPAPETAGAGADGHGDEETDGAPTPVPPRTAAETTLAGIWAEVLGLPLARVGVEDNFFALGGDSILSIQVVARATRAGLRLTPRQLFQHQTVAELAAVAGTAPAVQAEQETLTGPVPLTPIQRWFFEQDLPAPQHWNQAHAVTASRPLRPDLLRAAVGHVLEHHDALRLRFRRTPGGDWAQEYAPPALPGSLSAPPPSPAPPDDVPCRAVDLSDLSAERQGAALEALAGEAQASLDLEHGPLLRAVHCILGGGRPERLLIAIHHLVVDAVSWPILLEDLQDAYRQLEQGQAPRLAPKTTGFRTWAERLMEHTASDAVQAERDYWASQPWESVLPLPVDAAAPEANVEGTAQAVVASLTPDETQVLLQGAPGTYRARVDDLLLTALAQSFAAWTGERSLLVDLEGHGREPLFEDIDLSRTVGWFTALYPVLLTLDTQPGSPPPGGLKAIKEQLRRVPGKGLGYGLLRYLDAGGAGALRSLPQPEVSFNYLGRVEQPVAAQPAAAQPDAGQAGQAAPALLVPAGGDCGPLYDPRSPRRHLLDVVCDVSEERLQLRWIYSPAVHRRETVQGLADGFLGALRALLSPDREAPGAGFTPSDFPRARLDQKQLDTFLAGLGRAAKR